MIARLTVIAANYLLVAQVSLMEVKVTAVGTATILEDIRLGERMHSSAALQILAPVLHILGPGGIQVDLTGTKGKRICECQNKDRDSEEKILIYKRYNQTHLQIRATKFNLGTPFTETIGMSC